MTTRDDVLALVDDIEAEVDRRLVALKGGPSDTETMLQAALNRVLGEYQSVMAGFVKKGKPIPQSVYDDMTDELRGVLEDELRASYISSATATQQALENKIGMSINWQASNVNAQTWAKDYSFELVKGLQDTTIAQVRDNIASLQRDVSDFFGEPTTIASLEGNISKYIPDWTDRLGKVWSSPERAAMIARTEVTRASVQGDLDSVQFLADDYGIEMIPVWLTNVDEIVCEICQPLNGKQQGRGWTEPPPAHVNCRCSIAFERKP